MSSSGNGEEAVGSGSGRIDALVQWFELNKADLPIGLAVAGTIVLFMMALRWVGGRLIASDPDCSRWSGLIGSVLTKTKLFFMIAAAIDIVVTYAEVPPHLGRLADIFFTIAFALQGAIWGRELILGLIGRKVADDPGESTLSNAMSLIRVLVSVGLFAIAIIVILDNLGVNVTALVAGLGIGGIAIGLAAQGIFSDLFAALAILFDKPFRKGDTIRYDQTVGTVERIGLKTTRLRSVTGEVRVMANTKLLEREIQNLAGGSSRTTTLLFGLVYQTAPDLLDHVPELARGVVSSRSGCKLNRCAIVGFGPSSIDFELLFESASTDIVVIAADRTRIVTDLMRVFALQGIEFAYPTQTTFTAAPDGKLVMPYSTHPVVIEKQDCDEEQTDARSGA